MSEVTNRPACLAQVGGGQDLPGAERARWFLANLPAITAACADAGPSIYAAHAREIEKMDLG